MSTENDHVEALKEEIVDVEWRERVATMLLTLGILAFGVALGVKWAAVDTINTIGVNGGINMLLVELSGVYNDQMTTALLVALVCLVSTVLIEQH